MGDTRAITSVASAVFIELEDYDQDLATQTTFGKQRKVNQKCFALVVQKSCKQDHSPSVDLHHTVLKTIQMRSGEKLVIQSVVGFGPNFDGLRQCE